MKLFTKTLSLLTAVCMTSAIILSGCTVETAPPSSVETTAAQTTENTSAAETTVDATTQPKSDRQEPLMWQVTGKDGGKMYLFGTIHLGDERNEQIMKKIASKVDECDSLAVECDTVAYQNDYSAMIKNVYNMMYTDGTSVKDHMSAELYDKCKEYLSERDSYNQMYDMYHLSFWIQLLEQTAIAESPLDTELAMDTLLINHANDNDQNILEVESVDEQYEMLDSFSDEMYDLLLKEFFDSEKSYTDSISEMYEAWVVGDDSKLLEMLESDEESDEEELTEDQKKMVEDYNDKMYTSRNLKMAQKAQKYIESGQTVFFAVGTAHMLSDEGLVKLLTDKGYTVEKITA